MNNEKQESIEEIIKGCLKGDRKSQQVLYKMHYGKMFGVCMRYAKDRDNALDILQEGFLKIFMHLKSFEGRGSLEGWMRRIMVNTAIDIIRKNKLISQDLRNAYIEEHVSDEVEEDDKYLNISPTEIMKAVQQLSPAYRTVFSMYVIDGFSHKEIAEHLGISEGSSKSNLSKAKKNLKNILINSLTIRE